MIVYLSRKSKFSNVIGFRLFGLVTYEPYQTRGVLSMSQWRLEVTGGTNF